MKTKVGRMHGVAWLGVACLGLLLPPMAVSCSRQKTSEAAQAYFNQGLSHDQRGEHDKAIADYTEAIRLDPKLPQAYNNRGLSYDKKGEDDKAIADFTEAIRLDPEFAEAYSNRAKAYRALGDKAKAASDEKKAQELSK